jgi:hypothetical protein
MACITASFGVLPHPRTTAFKERNHQPLEKCKWGFIFHPQRESLDCDMRVQVCYPSKLQIYICTATTH